MFTSRARLTNVIVKNTVKGPNGGTGNGMDISVGSAVTVEGLTVDSNEGTGIGVEYNSVLTNRAWNGALTVTNNGAEGISVATNSSVQLPGVTITGNKGVGLMLLINAGASFWTPATIPNSSLTKIGAIYP